MSDHDLDASPWAGVELLERAIGYTRGALALVSADLMTAPTPCSEWDVRQLLLHMDDSLTLLLEAGATHRLQVYRPAAVAGSPAAGSLRTASAEELVDRLRDRACRLLGQWTADWAAGPRSPQDVVVGDRPLTSAVLTSAGALEIAVHGWDLATACAVRRPLPDDLATALLRIAPVLVGPTDRPGRFAEPLGNRPNAGPADRLLAFLGRSVG